jgi:hypothetical protein
MCRSERAVHSEMHPPHSSKKTPKQSRHRDAREQSKKKCESENGVPHQKLRLRVDVSLAASNRRKADSGVTRRLQCAVKGAGPQREIDPPGNWIAPPGGNRSGGGDNKAVGASGVEGRIRRLGESVGRNVCER